jgi:hypothetical protein
VVDASLQPPDPSKVIGEAKGGGRVRPGPTIASSITFEPAAAAFRRYERAADPQWEGFKDSAGTGVPVAEAMGAIDLAREGDLTKKQVAAGVVPPSAGDVIFGDLLTAGPYEALAYEDEFGPVSTTVGGYFRDESTRYLEEEGFYSRRGYGYRNLGESPSATLVSSVGKSPAPISQSPTSTTNPNRPRTVAAGWDRERQVLTTIFRDGTFYNYYGVSGLEWSNFTRARSKGRFIKTYLDNKVRGYADTASIPSAHQELLYKAARTTQVMKGGYTAGQKVGSKRGARTGRYAYGQSGTSASGGRRYGRTTGRYRATVR